MKLGTPDLRGNNVVKFYGLLLPVYGMPNYVSVMVGNQKRNPRFESDIGCKVIWLAASKIRPANLCVSNGLKLILGPQISQPSTF